MKTLDINQLEILRGGDDLDDIAGGLACGIAVGSLITGNVLGTIFGGISCYNYLRKL